MISSDKFYLFVIFYQTDSWSRCTVSHWTTHTYYSRFKMFISKANLIVFCLFVFVNNGTFELNAVEKTDKQAFREKKCPFYALQTENSTCVCISKWKCFDLCGFYVWKRIVVRCRYSFIFVASIFYSPTKVSASNWNKRNHFSLCQLKTSQSIQFNAKHVKRQTKTITKKMQKKQHHFSWCAK